MDIIEVALVAVLALIVAALFWKHYHPARPSNGMLGDSVDDEN